MEPTIYKPSIYKGAGIYKTGAEGGNIDSVEIGGRIYSVVKIDDKYWMAENLRYETSLYSYPNNNAANIDKCGLLYSYTIICDEIFPLIPPGWRLPRMVDFKKLFTEHSNSLDYISIDKGGNNSLGFNDNLAGWRSNDGSFGGFGSWASYWTDTFKDVTTTSPYLIRNYSGALSVNNVLDYNDNSAIGEVGGTLHTEIALRLIHD